MCHFSSPNPSVFLQPLQFFSDLDFSMPGILVQRMAFSGKNQQGAGDTELMQRAVKQIVLRDSNTNVIGSGYHVSRGFHFGDLIDCRFVVVTALGFPREASEEIGVIESRVIVSPIGYMFDGTTPAPITLQSTLIALGLEPFEGRTGRGGIATTRPSRLRSAKTKQDARLGLRDCV